MTPSSGWVSGVLQLSQVQSLSSNLKGSVELQISSATNANFCQLDLKCTAVVSVTSVHVANASGYTRQLYINQDDFTGAVPMSETKNVDDKKTDWIMDSLFLKSLSASLLYFNNGIMVTTLEVVVSHSTDQSHFSFVQILFTTSTPGFLTAPKETAEILAMQKYVYLSNQPPRRNIEKEHKPTRHRILKLVHSSFSRSS